MKEIKLPPGFKPAENSHSNEVKTPMVGLTKALMISFNNAAVKALDIDKHNFVDLFYNDEEGNESIIIVPTNDDEPLPHRRKILRSDYRPGRKPRYEVHGTSVLKPLGVTPVKARKVELKIKEGYGRFFPKDY